MDTQSDIELLAKTGSALFGHDWQRAMGRALERNERTIRRWAKGEAPVNPDTWNQLRILAHQQAIALRETMGLINQRAKKERLAS